MSCFFRILKVIHWLGSKICPTERKHSEVPIRNLPWFWIGADINNTQVGITDLVNKAVKNNSVVTTDFLSEVSGYHQPVTWKYIDAITLEQKEFPPSGIVIENAS
jgi:hypothetical protein